MTLLPTDSEYAKIKEQVIQHYLETPSGREKLIQSVFGPAKDMLLHAKEHPEAFTNSSFASTVFRLLRVMERIEASMDGREVYAKALFEKILGDLKALYSAMPSAEHT